MPRPTPAADALLASKKNRDLLEPYEERLAAAVGYMQLLNPGATVTAGPLSDPQVLQGGVGLSHEAAWAPAPQPLNMGRLWVAPGSPGRAAGEQAQVQAAAGGAAGVPAPLLPLRLPALCVAPPDTCRPQEPPICATDPDFDAIVVSEETVPGAHAINQVLCVGNVCTEGMLDAGE